MLNEFDVGVLIYDPSPSNWLIVPLKISRQHYHVKSDGASCAGTKVRERERMIDDDCRHKMIKYPNASLSSIVHIHNKVIRFDSSLRLVYLWKMKVHLQAIYIHDKMIYVHFNVAEE